MPAAAALNRVNTLDFFAALVPGFYLFLAASLPVIVWVDPQLHVLPAAPTVPAATQPGAPSIVETIANSWPLPVAIALASYLLGAVLRAIPVDWADAYSLSLTSWRGRGFLLMGLVSLACVPLVGRLGLPIGVGCVMLAGIGRSRRHCLETGNSPKTENAQIGTYVEALRRDHAFPYPSLADFLESKLNGADPAAKSGKGNGRPTWHHTRYNYLKMVLCMRTPDAFRYVQELEARVRLFAGMFWAGVAGLIGASAAFFGSDRSSAAWQTWEPICLGFLVISLLIALVFGLRVRRVRGQEVEHLVLAYHAYCREVRPLGTAAQSPPDNAAFELTTASQD